MRAAKRIWIMDNFGQRVEKFISLFQGNSADAYISDILTGLQNTVKIAVLGLIIGIIIGTLIAAVRVMPKYKRLPRVLNAICGVYVGFFRGTPMVVQLLLFYYVALPLMEIHASSVAVAITVFGMNSGAYISEIMRDSGAYISEIMRGGIMSVDPGQMEGGRSVGLSFSTTMMKIVIPQAVKNIIPTLGNEFITLVKETSVVSFVGATDLYVAFRKIGTNTYEFMVPYIVMALIYIVLVLLITALIKLVERRLRKSDRGR